MKTMKTMMFHRFAAALFAVFATTAAADAGLRFDNHGRAGYVVSREKEKPAARAKTDRRETTVALVMEKPARPAATLQTAGRAGYQTTYRGSRGR